MEKYTAFITGEGIEGFRAWLISEERSVGTIEKYIRDIRALGNWLGERNLSNDSISEWKNWLVSDGYQPTTVNSMLAAVNSFCKYLGLECRIRFLRIQRQLFCDENRELNREEYIRLIAAARAKGKTRLELLLETIGGTGVRASEVRYFTVETVRTGRIRINLKGKIRIIWIPEKLRQKLLRYAKKAGIRSGEIFITRGGKSLSRKQIWAEMKKLCRDANIKEEKVFPHNLRHLFARIFYQMTRDVEKLADLLGHSSIETTRIYLRSSGEEHIRQMERMGLVF